MYAHDEFEPDHSTSPTGHVIEDLELYGHRPSEDEADPRNTPEDNVIQGAVADIFDALISTMADTSLDFDLDEILWSTVNTFHRSVERINANSTITSKPRNAFSANRMAVRSNPSSWRP